MKIWINGTQTILVQRYPLGSLLADLAISGRFAVEINGEIVPRNSFESRILCENDKVEIVKAIGGG